MSISLEKGQKISLTKENPSLDKIVVGLGWDVMLIEVSLVVTLIWMPVAFV